MLLASRLHSSNSDSNVVAHRHPRFARATLATGQGDAAVELEVRVELSHVGAEGRLALQPTLVCEECCSLEEGGRPSGMVQLGVSNTTVPAGPGASWS